MSGRFSFNINLIYLRTRHLVKCFAFSCRILQNTNSFVFSVWKKDATFSLLSNADGLALFFITRLCINYKIFFFLFKNSIFYRPGNWPLEKASTIRRSTHRIENNFWQRKQLRQNDPKRKKNLFKRCNEKKITRGFQLATI